MLVLGAGLGGVMQVLVIIVQNGVPHSELGVATSGATFFRSIGGSFGTAIFGAIFANVLVGNLASHLHGVSLPGGFSSADVTPAVLDRLPAAVHAGFVSGYAESIQTVFLIAVPIAALAFLATWLIPQVELKQWRVGRVRRANGAGAAGDAAATTIVPAADGPSGRSAVRSRSTRRTPAGPTRSRRPGTQLADGVTAEHARGPRRARRGPRRHSARQSAAEARGKAALVRHGDAADTRCPVAMPGSQRWQAGEKPASVRDNDLDCPNGTWHRDGLPPAEGVVGQRCPRRQGALDDGKYAWGNASVGDPRHRRHRPPVHPDLLLTGHAVTAVGSRTRESAERFAALFELPAAHASYESLVADPSVDLVLRGDAAPVPLPERAARARGGQARPGREAVHAQRGAGAAARVARRRPGPAGP